MYRIEFLDDEDKKIDYTMHNMEGKEYLQYKWLELDKIDEYDILPTCLKDMLKSKNYPMHIINKTCT